MLTENNFKYEMSKRVAVTDINDLAVNQRVTIVAKVISVSSPKENSKDDKSFQCRIAKLQMRMVIVELCSGRNISIN